MHPFLIALHAVDSSVTIQHKGLVLGVSINLVRQVYKIEIRSVGTGRKVGKPNSGFGLDRENHYTYFSLSQKGVSKNLL